MIRILFQSKRELKGRNKEIKETWNREKTNSKMIELNSITPVIILKVNGLKRLTLSAKKETF